MRIVVALIIVPLLFACSKDKQDSSAVDRKKFTVAYEHYLKSVTSDTAKPELYPAYLDSALREAGMKKKDFYQAIDYFKNHPDEFDQVLTDVNSYLQKLEREERNNKPQSSKNTKY